MITHVKLRGIREAVDVAHIEKTLEAVARVQSVVIDRENETATVAHEGANLDEIKAAARAMNLIAELRESTGRDAGPSTHPRIILAPIDFSDVTDRVVHEAAKLARVLQGRVVLVNVTEPTTGVVDYAAIVVAVAQVNEAAVKYAVERLAALEKQLKHEGVDATSVQVTGTPRSEIIEQAQKLSADYIVIGSHGHSAFYDLLVGGTAHGVLKRAKCPVIIVPAPIEDRGK
jgi:nucleotide-binding universal stress UspA family protein